MKKYSVFPDESADGGYCDFYDIIGHIKLGFKSFKHKTKAVAAYNNQKKLSAVDLAPKVVGKICKLPYKDCLGRTHYTGWGYVTEKAQMIPYHKKIPYISLQKLVNKIHKKTGLKFWDCHTENVGYINNKLVCIDTGSESFYRDYNAWGFNTPGPICPDCKKKQCYCGV